MAEMSELVSIQVVQYAKKNESVFERKYCHPKMHRKNYLVVASFRFSREFAWELERQESKAVDKLVKILQQQNVHGECNILRNYGGTGRPRKYESKAKARARHPMLGPKVIIKNLRA